MSEHFNLENNALPFLNFRWFELLWPFLFGLPTCRLFNFVSICDQNLEKNQNGKDETLRTDRSGLMGSVCSR